MDRATLRAYDDADADATLEIFRAAVHRTAASHYSAEQRAAWAPDDLDELGWADRRGRARTVVAEVEGRVVGFTDLDATGHVDMLFVHPDVGGRGVGAVLLEHVIALARREGIGRLTVEASHVAKPVFERAGFSVDERQEVVRGGVVLENFRMSRVS